MSAREDAIGIVVYVFATDEDRAALEQRPDVYNWLNELVRYEAQRLLPIALLRMRTTLVIEDGAGTDGAQAS